MTVSIPEKTLEHWASHYITYRFKARAELWWPTRGEDIRVESLPGRGAGKLFNIEVKTATPVAGGGHEVKVRLYQLERYIAAGIPTYYALPTPPWSGVVTAPGATPVRPPRMAFSRTAALIPARPGSRRRKDFSWWFANWMVVVRDVDLYRALRPAYAGKIIDKRTEEVVYTYDDAAGGFVTDPFGVVGLLEPWRDFWKIMADCGDDDHPSVFRAGYDLPPKLNHTQLRSAVTQARAAPEGVLDESLALYLPALEGQSQIYERAVLDGPLIAAGSVDFESTVTTFLTL